MWYGDRMGGYGWNLGMMLFMSLFWLLVVVAVAALVWSLARGRSASAGLPGEKTPLQILEERYARGEIDKAEFEQKKKDLQR